MDWTGIRPVGTLALVVGLCLAINGCKSKADTHRVTSIGEVSGLPSQIASGRYPIQFQGWVTVPDRAANMLCVEDATGAARAWNLSASKGASSQKTGSRLPAWLSPEARLPL